MMKSSETPPPNRACLLESSSLNKWSRYLAASPTHNLRITPSLGRDSCIPKAPDNVGPKVLGEALLASEADSGLYGNPPIVALQHKYVGASAIVRGMHN